MSHTIAAVSTGNVVSAIGILRLSGDDCIAVAQAVVTLDSGLPLEQAPSRKLLMGRLRDRQGRVIDQVMVAVSRCPHSYTGEDTVEFHCHGSPAVLAAGLEALYAAGAQPARRGEFTKRAFLNGKLALTQAEAVIDLIEADTADAAANAAGQVGGVLQKRLAPIYQELVNICSHFHAVLDYPDEDIEDFGLDRYAGSLRRCALALEKLLATWRQGSILRSGVTAAIVGRPNVGKSSILNALAGFERCIVTDIPGTTRDTIEETVLLGNVKLRLIDTAGIRQTADTVEAMGVERSLEAVRNARLAIFVCDGSRPLEPEDQTIIDACCDKEYAIALVNKADLGRVVQPAQLPFVNVIFTSATDGLGLEQLRDVVQELFENHTPCDGSILTNPRQCDAIARAHGALVRALAGIRLGLTPDAALTDVEQAMEAMGEVTGATVREDITSRIFERFCVGK